VKWEEGRKKNERSRRAGFDVRVERKGQRKKRDMAWVGMCGVCEDQRGGGEKGRSNRQTRIKRKKSRFRGKACLRGASKKGNETRGEKKEGEETPMKSPMKGRVKKKKKRPKNNNNKGGTGKKEK